MLIEVQSKNERENEIIYLEYLEIKYHLKTRFSYKKMFGIEIKYYFIANTSRNVATG